jgi:hypothetical protein
MQEPVLGSNRDEPKGVSLFPSYRAAAAKTTHASRAPGAESIVLRKQPSVLEVLAIGGIGIAALYFGRDVFMPLADAAIHNGALASVDEFAVVVIHRSCGRSRLVVAHRFGPWFWKMLLRFRLIRPASVAMSPCSCGAGFSSATSLVNS